MKKQQIPKPKTTELALQKETLGLLRGVVGMSRIHIPIGYEDDTTPIYRDEDNYDTGG
ncbi:MAG TPA: hypothetical protein VF789_04835 [Thermoanaerobaculia bacterium]